MVNYQLGKIYKITSIHTDKCYIGSTCEPRLSRRLSKHRTDYKCYLKGVKNNITSFEILKLGDYDITLIELYPCNSKDELHKRERYYIERLDCVNKNIPLRTTKEYYKDNKDYYTEYRKNNKDNMDDYYKNNKDKILKRRKEHYEKNKDKIKVKTVCECGGRYTKQNKQQHFKTKKHIKYIE